MIPEDADAAPCGTCWAPVLLDHDPPAQCGTVTCPDCPPHECVECATPCCPDPDCPGNPCDFPGYADNH